MNHKFLIVAAMLFLISPAGADFESAANVYRSKDYVTAYQEFLALANAGDPRAQTIVAMMHKYGESVPEDPAQSFAWYQKAAEAGYAPAQFNLGEMYARGLGVERDPEAAVMWLSRAAEAGYERANDTLSELNVDPVTTGAKVDALVPWSKHWNLRLPNQVRFDESQAAPPLDAAYRVQLGAMKTQASAYRLWELTTTANAELFRGYEPMIELAGEEDSRIYRVQTGPFDNFRDARLFCENLLKQDSRAGCMPRRQ